MLSRSVSSVGMVPADQPHQSATHVDLDRCAHKSWSLLLAYQTAALAVLCRTSSRAPGPKKWLFRFLFLVPSFAVRSCHHCLRTGLLAGMGRTHFCLVPRGSSVRHLKMQTACADGCLADQAMERTDSCARHGLFTFTRASSLVVSRLPS